MKSFFTLTFVLVIFIAVVGGGGLLWYLSYTTKFERKDVHTSALAPSKASPPPAAAPGTRPAGPSPAPPR